LIVKLSAKNRTVCLWALPSSISSMLTLALVIASAVASTASADTIFSENFDSPALTEASGVRGAPSDYATGATGDLTIATGGDYYAPFGHSQYLVMNPTSSQTPDGVIYWDFAAPAGTWSTSFDFVPFCWADDVQSIAVSVTQGATILYSGTFSHTYGGDFYVRSWSSPAFSNTSAGTIRLQFTDLTTLTYGNGADLLVDNVMVSGTAAQTPEPGTLVLLVAGLIGLLAYAWRKRK
jgi:hypothetical protein